MLKHHGLSANTLSFGIGDVWISIFTTPYSSDTMVEVIKLSESQFLHLPIVYLSVLQGLEIMLIRLKYCWYHKQVFTMRNYFNIT